MAAPGLGNYVWINHGNGWISRYAHLQQILVKQGATVKQGQPIALSGYSGLSDAKQAHLHFSLRSGATNQWDGYSTAPEPMYGDSSASYTGFGSYGVEKGQVSPPYTAPSPGGWWLGPTPSDWTPPTDPKKVVIGFQPVDLNGNGGVDHVNITVWTASSNTWTSHTVYPDPNKNGQVMYSFPQTMTEPTIVGADVYAKNGRFQLAPQGIRRLCLYNAQKGQDCPPSTIAYWDGSDFPGGAAGGGSSGTSSGGSNSGPSDGFQVCTGANYTGDCQTFSYISSSVCVSLGSLAVNQNSVRFLGNYVGNYGVNMYHDNGCGTFQSQS